MPFFLPVLFGTAFGSFLVNTAVNVAISVGLGYLSKKLSKKNAPRPTGGAVLEVEYGENTPRYVAIGLCCVAGKHIYDNSFSTANRTLQRVLKLSDFYTTSLQRVAIDGEWVTLGPEDPTKGFPVTTAKYQGYVWIKYYDGRQTTADAYLVANDNPDGRWTADHKGIGVSYAIITMEYDQEKFNSIPQFLIEFDGAPLYDISKDTTVGGNGTYRFDDVSTWEYSDSPILADYCYRRGFSVNGDLFCGMDTPPSDLPYSEYVAANSICGEQVDGENRYAVSIFLDATREHGDNIDDLMAACVGRPVDSVEGQYPLIGASQVPVATLSKSDLVDGQPVVFNRFRAMSELVNTVSGTYSEPDFVYQPVGYDEQTLPATVAIDRRTLDVNLNFPMVTSKRQAEQLASIYFNENRREAEKTIVVQEKWQVLSMGDWITYLDDEDGEPSRIYQIMGMNIASFDNAPQRHVQLSLEERHADIYAGIGVVTPPVLPTPNNDPVYLQELANFAAVPSYVSAENGDKYPLIRASWAGITDPTVVNVILEWRVKAGPGETIHKIVSNNEFIAILQEGVVGSTEYEVRNRLITSPRRAATSSAWISVTTDPPPKFDVTLSQMQPDVTQTLVNVRRDADDARDLFNMDMPTVSSIDMARSFIARREVKREGKGTLARLIEQEDVQANDQEAVASQLISLETVTGNNTSGLAQEITARTTQFDANTLAIQTAQSQANGNTAGIAAEAVTRADADATNTLAIQTAQSQANGNTAGIAAEAVTRADADATNTLAIQTAQSQANGNTAGIAAEEITRTTQFDAIASSAATAQATANEGTATGHSKLEVSAGPAGWDAQIQWYLRAANDVGENYVEAALWMRAMLNANGGDSQIGLKAGQIVLVNSLGVILLLAGDDGIIIPGRIPEITVGMIKALTITADRFVLNGATGEGTASVLTGSYVRSITGTDWEDLDSMSVTMDVADYAKVMLIAKVNSIDEYSQNYSIELRITDNGTAVTTETALHAGKGEIHLTVFTQPIEIGASHTYKIQWKKTVWSADTTQVLHRSLKAMQFKM